MYGPRWDPQQEVGVVLGAVEPGAGSSLGTVGLMLREQGSMAASRERTSIEMMLNRFNFLSSFLIIFTVCLIVIKVFVAWLR